eukprot:Hpha_TRINITY_DN35596_c0_g1::TRINITY_DN35596_c0_g1_i1::g.84540::m.84540
MGNALCPLPPTDVHYHPSTEEWVPDEDAPSCNQCGKPFTVLRRRHHCRACGRVFCADHSSHKRALAGAGYNRVCDFCFDTYSDRPAVITQTPFQSPRRPKAHEVSAASLAPSLPRELPSEPRAKAVRGGGDTPVEFLECSDAPGDMDEEKPEEEDEEEIVWRPLRLKPEDPETDLRFRHLSPSARAMIRRALTVFWESPEDPHNDWQAVKETAEFRVWRRLRDIHNRANIAQFYLAVSGFERFNQAEVSLGK